MISWMPRTSPTFQSFFGLSGCVLWQVTQACAHEHRRRDADDAVEDRARDLDHRLLRDRRAARSMRLPLERVELVCAARPLNGKSETKRYLHGAVCALITLAEFERQGRRDRDARRHVAIIVRRRHRSVRRQHAPDHVARIEVAHVVDDAADLARLPAADARTARAGRARPRAAGREGQAQPLPPEAAPSSAVALRRARRARP